ncbi:hypothetical protein MT418_000486 [Batrachochytrium dendrobatidis]
MSTTGRTGAGFRQQSTPLQTICGKIQRKLGILDLLLNDVEQHILCTNFKKCYSEEWTRLMNTLSESVSLSLDTVIPIHLDPDIPHPSSTRHQTESDPYKPCDTIANHLCHFTRMTQFLTDKKNKRLMSPRTLSTKTCKKWLKNILWDLKYQPISYLVEFMYYDGFVSILNLGDAAISPLGRCCWGFKIQTIWVKIVQTIIQSKEAMAMQVDGMLLVQCLKIVLKLALSHHILNPLNTADISWIWRRSKHTFGYTWQPIQSSIDIPSILIQNTPCNDHSITLRIICFEIIKTMAQSGPLAWTCVEQILLRETILVTPSFPWVTNPFVPRPTEATMCKLWAIELAGLISEMEVGEYSSFASSQKKVFESLATRVSLSYPTYSKKHSKVFVLCMPPSCLAWKYLWTMLNAMASFVEHAPNFYGLLSIQAFLGGQTSPTLGSSIRQIHLHSLNYSLLAFTNKIYPHLPILPSYSSRPIQPTKARKVTTSQARRLPKKSKHVTPSRFVSFRVGVTGEESLTIAHAEGGSTAIQSQ